ncbi:MAG: hypothetical protein EBX52_00650 [Proteobacteria bacterium]|nr:hypothetical protein [Pseudomonadota bacterium]
MIFLLLMAAIPFSAGATSCPDLTGSYVFRAEDNSHCNGFPGGMDSEYFPAKFSLREGDRIEISQKGCDELTLSFQDPGADPARTFIRTLDLKKEEVHRGRIIHNRSHDSALGGYGGAAIGTSSHRWSLRLTRKKHLRIRANASESGWFSGPLGVQPYLEWRFARCELSPR